MDKIWPELSAFLEHCCTNRSYFFTIKKCGVADCEICPPPVLPPDQFAELHPFPDPVPGDEGHYKDFSELYGIEETSEEFCPSHRQKKTSSVHHGHDIPFSPSAQTAKTCQQTVACIECNRPRVVYAASKLSNSEQSLLTRLLSMYHYSCGSILQELQPEDASKAPRINALLTKVYVRSNITCDTPIEVPYFSSKCFPPVCFHCGSDTDLVIKESQYPMCKICDTRDKQALKRKRNVWEERKGSKKTKS
ncbi:uncharacterized protein LOC117344244 [Pecten maximus]|uniref:uncharacterized protein LOC117344244 n=1 Tax=Pecten maximus TaxID=6579 RepID=UPI001458372E|nr:uncharacterized protein LOC117344244 [Pecten maximus]